MTHVAAGLPVQTLHRDASRLKDLSLAAITGSSNFSFDNPVIACYNFPRLKYISDRVSRRARTAIPLLQVALDYISLSPALAMALQVADEIDIIEMGTPLCKAAGVEAIRPSGRFALTSSSWPTSSLPGLISWLSTTGCPEGSDED